MTDNEDDIESVTEPAAQGPVAGERLAVARRAAKISVMEIAKELHLDEPKVRALESNDFAVLGAPVFAKGHLKKYAQLVGVNFDDVLDEYYKINREQGLQPVIEVRRRLSKEPSPGPWIAIVILVLAAAVAYWWFVGRDSVPTPAKSTPSLPMSSLSAKPLEPSAMSPAVSPQPADLQADEQAAAGLATETTEVDTASNGNDATNDVSPPLQPAPDSGQPPPANGDVRLALMFTGDCWTEVTDADGKRLFFGLGADGRQVSVTGMPPLSVLVGDATHVTLSVNGANYPIRPSNRRGQTARLTIAGP